MILNVKKTGLETNNLCRVDVAIPSSSEGVRLVSINIPHNAGHWLDEQVDAFTVLGVTYTIPAQPSYLDFRKWMNLFKDPAGFRVFFVYGEEDFDFCIGFNQVVLSESFATRFGLQTILPPMICYSSQWSKIELNPVYDYEVKFVSPIEVPEEGGYTIGVVHETRGLAFSNHVHKFNDSAAHGTLEIRCRLKDGNSFIARCADTDSWGCELEF